MLPLPEMKDSDLYSRAWCDMVFEGRNRAYGAYVLRRNAGRRYRFAMMVVGGAFVVMVVLVLSLIAALIYGLWLLCANWNRRKPTKKIHRRY